MQLFQVFRKLFNRALTDFWLDNARGFDAAAFEQFVAGSKTVPLTTRVKRRWGADAADVVKQLLVCSKNAG